MVKRYDFDKFQGVVSQEEYPGIGDWVEHSDYAALQASHARLMASIKAAMAFINSHVADPDITDEMVQRYAELQQSKPGEAIAAGRQFEEK